jgi:isopenicillin-N epimerase
MGINPRDFLISAGLAAASGVTTIGATACRGDMPGRQQSTADEFGTDPWNDVRAHFELDPEYIHLAGLLLSSHPQPVRAALDEHRCVLNQNPTYYVQEHNSPLKARVREAAARYMGVNPNEIALTDSTTMGTALVITGLQVSSGQEMLTARFDYYSTHESLRYQARRSGATVREPPLYQDIQTVTEDEIVDTLLAEMRPETRLITATWIHSATGLKVPIRSIAEQLAEINKNRSGTDRVVFFVDRVHGFGVENVLVADLGCDFFAAGTHSGSLAPGAQA